MSGYLGFFMLAFLFMILGVAMLIINNILGIKRPSREKYIGYECGLDPSGDARIPFRIRFYLIALIFLVFDVEVAFLYPWAIIFEELHWFGLIEIIIFVGMLLIAYIYAWSEGALEWE